MLSVSHIAWSEHHEIKALELLSQLGVHTIELAPVRAFGNLLEAREETVKARAEWYAALGFTISSFQALLFGTSDLLLFSSKESREKLKQWLFAVAQTASWSGAKALVFGSPKNRFRGDITPLAALRIAVPFFREVGDFCASVGTRLLIEPNPEHYGADFCTSIEESVALIRNVDSPGFGLHIDAGGLAISGEKFTSLLREIGESIHHVHASQPDLANWDEPHPIHHQLANILREIGYRGDIALEMKAQPNEFGALQKAVESFSRIYCP